MFTLRERRGILNAASLSSFIEKKLDTFSKRHAKVFAGVPEKIREPLDRIRRKPKGSRGQKKLPHKGAENPQPMWGICLDTCVFCWVVFPITKSFLYLLWNYQRVRCAFQRNRLELVPC